MRQPRKIIINLAYFLDRGLVKAPLFIQTCLGILGGNVRIGLEDSLWAGRGRLAETNAQQVTLARQIIEGMGLSVATPDEARQILGLQGGDKVEF